MHCVENGFRIGWDELFSSEKSEKGDCERGGLKGELSGSFSLKFILEKYTWEEDLEINFIKILCAMYPLENPSEPAVVCLSQSEDTAVEEKLTAKQNGV